MWGNRTSHSLFVGTKNCTVILEDSLAISYKTKPTFTVQSSSHILWYLLKELEDFVHTKTFTQSFVAALFMSA